MHRLAIPIAIVAAGQAAPALAAEPTAATSAAAAEIVVTGERVRYGARATPTATRTPTAIIDIPQALTTISEAQIEDQQLRSIADLLNFVPGASYGSGEGNRDQIVLRGNGSTADFFIDGVRDDVQYFRDFYNVERVEILKGPNAMIFGRGGGGGIVNRVLKRPTFAARRQLAASGDGFGGVRLTGDVDQPLGGAAAVRVNAMVERGDSFRDHVTLRRWGFNPAAAFTTAGGARIDIGVERFHDARTADRGVPANGNRPLAGHSTTFFGDPDVSVARADVTLANVAVEHEFADGLTLRNRTQLGRYDKFYQNVFASGLNPVAKLVELAGYNNRNDRKTIFSQTDLVWEHRLGPLEQTLLAGVEIGREQSRNKRATALFPHGRLVPLSDPTVDSGAQFMTTPSDAENRVRATVAAVYLQSQLKPADWLQVIAGLRFDSFKVEVDDLRAAGGTFARRDRLWSPRLGLVVKPTDRLSLYASLSRSYLPQSGDQFSGLTDVTAALKPERFDNREVGAKWEILDGLLATIAAYRLDRSNTRATDPADPSRTVLTGEQRSKGIEVGLERSISSRWLISAGYALQSARIEKSTTAAPAGRQVPLVPRHSFSLWNRYSVTPSFGFGLGLIARSKTYASISNAVTLPGYARLDAALYYAMPGGMEAQLNVENLLGANYFATANADNNIAPGAPRAVKATVGYRF